jgi:hypothetical protein
MECEIIVRCVHWSDSVDPEELCRVIDERLGGLDWVFGVDTDPDSIRRRPREEERG